MINFIRNLICPSKKSDESVDKLKRQIIKKKEQDVKTLQQVNKRIRVLLEQGEIEVVIKNVKGVIKEI